MSVIDKRNVLPSMRGGVLELGVGNYKTNRDAIGVDILDTPAADVVGDVFEVLAQIRDGAVRRIESAHFFEHIDDTERLLAACARVLEPQGVMQVMVPHFSNPYFYSDPTHRATYGLYTFSYWADTDLFRREVPNYIGNRDFRLTDARMIFRREGGPRRALDRLASRWVNRSRARQEFYERRLCYAVPCYELQFTLTRT